MGISLAQMLGGVSWEDVYMRQEKYIYRTHLAWGEGYTWRQGAEGGRPDIVCSSPPEFKGVDGLWTPEHMLLASIESCVASAFYAYMTHARLEILSYRSEAEGVMSWEGKKLKFTEARVKAFIKVRKTDRESAEKLLEKAHARCPLTNSVSFPVSLEVEWQTE